MSLKDFYALLARLFLGYVFFSSGLCKLADGHFGQIIGPPFLIADLEPYGLGGFAVFLGFSQVMTGALVLSQRWSLLGLVMLVPLNVSILAATISMQWQGTPFVNAFLLIINLFCLLYEWKTLRFFLLPDTTEQQLPARTTQIFTNNGMAFGVLTLALAAAISARMFPALLLVFGVAALVLAWANAWKSGGCTFLAKGVLAASLLAVLGLSLSEPLTEMKINVLIPLLGGIGLSTIGTVALTLRFWLSKK